MHFRQLALRELRICSSSCSNAIQAVSSKAAQKSVAARAVMQFRQLAVRHLKESVAARALMKFRQLAVRQLRNL
jgi:hypothetical protein